MEKCHNEISVRLKVNFNQQQLLICDSVTKNQSKENQLTKWNLGKKCRTVIWNHSCTSLAASLKKCQLNTFGQFSFFKKKQQINITTQD